MLKLWEVWRRICKLHRSDDETAKGEIADFFLPRVTGGFLIRLAIVALTAMAVFHYLLIPCIITGTSMEPTVRRTGFTFCWRGKYWGKAPVRGDIVVLRYANRVYYLKRIVGLPGERVAFHRGFLFVNGRPLREPYVHFACDWELPERTVRNGHYYVVGDNRSMPLDQHRFGQVSAHRIAGAPLW